MADNVIMKGRDTVFAGLAQCFVTIEGRRYNFMQAINLEAKFEKNKIKVRLTVRGNAQLHVEQAGIDGCSAVFGGFWVQMETITP